MEENKAFIDKLIEQKRKYLTEIGVLEEIPKKEKTKEQRHKMHQLMVQVREINIDLAKYGYMPRKVTMEQDGFILMALKNILEENFGADKTYKALDNAEERVKTSTRIKFNFISPEEEEILSSKNKVAEINQTLKHMIGKISELKEYLSQKIRVESDYNIRNIYSDIFKRL